MVPDTNRTDGGDADASAVETDGGAGPGFDEAALYVVVRDAVKDALLDVIGTLLLVGIAFVLVLAGGQALFASLTTGARTPAVVIGSVVVIAVGVYVAAATLEIVPPIREWR
jgi:hypothetical protein